MGTKIEWLTLNLEQFKAFLKTEESKSRFFLKIEDDLGGEAPHIYCEVDEDKKKEMLSEKRHAQYINDMKKKYGYQTVSYQYMAEDLDDECEGAEVIAGDTDFIEDILDKTFTEELLKHLLPNEKWMLKELVLTDEPKSERELSKLSGIPQRTINDRKRKLFEKIKKYF